MAFDFTGTSTDSMQYGDDAGHDGLTNVSWAFHVDRSTDVNAHRYISKWDGANSPWLVLMRAGGIVRLNVGTGSASGTADSTTTFATGTPSTVVVTYDTANVRHVINGTDDGETALTTAMGADVSVITIGDDINPSTKSFGGSIEHVFMWNTTLSAAECQSWTAGMIPSPESLVFWQPCWSKTMPDLITGFAATEVGSVGVSDGMIGLNVPRFPSRGGFGAPSVSALLKVLDESGNIAEGRLNLLGLLKVIDEDENLQEAFLDNLGLLQVLAEAVDIRDGGGFNTWDPWGKVEETMSDGTVWKKIFPPYAKRTRWS